MELKEIRRKIESVSNIGKLTSALETLSALKMKKAQKIALQSRPFSQKIGHILRHLEPALREIREPILKRKVKNILAVVVASDRGFCGPFNQNILRLAEKEIKNLEIETPVSILAVGKKATTFFNKKGKKIEYNFFGIGDYGELEETKPISDFMVRVFLENKFQRVYLIWTNFISTFFQKPNVVQLLPMRNETLQQFIKEDITHLEAVAPVIEPSVETVYWEIVPQLIEYLLFQCILESNASEHSARMIAMKNASDNARNRVVELTLDYNKARQEKITREVCEISSAKEALE